MTYLMRCTCGHEISVEADSKEEAVRLMQQQMTQEAFDAHWQQNHKNDLGSKPTLEQSHAMIEQTLHEAGAAAMA